MIDTGKLKITLCCENGKIRNIEIESTEPLNTKRFFIDKTPEQTLKILPSLFNSCDIAQSFTSFNSYLQALGIVENPAETATRNILLNIEIVREYGWFFLLNKDKSRLAPFLKNIIDFKKSLFASRDSFRLNTQFEINYEELNNFIFQLETDLDSLFFNQQLRLLNTKNEDDLHVWLSENASVPAHLLCDLQTNNDQNLVHCIFHLLPKLVDFDFFTRFNRQPPTWAIFKSRSAVIDAGKLKITLWCENGKVRVEIESARPLHTSRLFIGKTPEQTLKILPLLFNVCGVAQSFAAFTACSQALGIIENPVETAARNFLLNVEIVREHTWFLLLNKDKSRLAPFLKYVTAFKNALFVDGDAFSLDSKLKINYEQLNHFICQFEKDLDSLFLNQRRELLEAKNEDDLNVWLSENTSIPALLLRDLQANNYQNLGRCALRLLPNLTNLDLQENFDSHTPTWQSECCETSNLNRQQKQPLIADLIEKYGNGLMTRLVSRLFELAMMPNVLKQNLIDLQMPFTANSHRIKSTTGVAKIQASRGLLIHKVELKYGLIANYQIIAPTEWNFQPNSVAAKSLQSLSAQDKTTLHQHAALIINTIDPCVSFELVIN